MRPLRLVPRNTRRRRNLRLATLGSIALGWLLASASLAQPFAILSAPILKSSTQVQVLDTETDSVRAELRLSEAFNGYGSVALSGRSDLVFLAPQGRSRLDVLALREGGKLAEFPLRSFISWMDALPDASKVYVSHQVGFDVVDLPSGTVREILDVGFSRAQGISVDSTGERVFLAISGQPSTLSVIDTATDLEIGRWDLPSASTSLQSVTLSNDDSTAFIADFSGGQVIVFDLTTGTEFTTIDVGLAPRAVTLSPDGTRLFASTIEGVAVIDTLTLTVTETLLPSEFTTAVDVHPDGTRLYVMDGIGTLSIFDASTLALLETVQTAFFDSLRSREFITPIDSPK